MSLGNLLVSLSRLLVNSHYLLVNLSNLLVNSHYLLVSLIDYF
ncbi:hypothetical protein [Peribacillus frigoritolerans]